MIDNHIPKIGKQKPGTLFGVGVGPGDPRLVTLGAIEVIQKVATVAFPVNKTGATSRAYEVVKVHVPPKTTRLPLLMPMTRDSGCLEAARAGAVTALNDAAAGGRDVAFLSLGDPFFYSTFGYLAPRFAGKVQVISGVTAMSAMAAAMGAPLAAGDMPTVVVTGVDHESLAAALKLEASVVIMKPRSLADRSLDLLETSGAIQRAGAVVELGNEKQQVIKKLDRQAAASLPYFAIIWIRPPR